jgi:DNA-binding transcriptional regulator LsrR (DeoR family)
LVEKFNLRGAHVVSWQNNQRYGELKARLGKAAAHVLRDIIKPNQIIGIAWGTSVQATIDAFEPKRFENVRVVQLLGVLGSTRHAYSGQALVERLARKLDGEGVYLYTPFIVENETTAKFLREDLSVREAITLGKQCDIALLGVGSTKPEFCSLFQGSHITKRDLTIITKSNAVGDVSGRYFDRAGILTDVDFHQRLMGISHEDLLQIPIRLGVAGNEEKAEAILGALRGGFLNMLVTDNLTASQILKYEENLNS